MCKLAITTIPSLAWLRRAVRRRRRRSGGNHTTAASASCFSSCPSCPCPDAVPAGHVAVCVEAGSGSTRRFVVPLAHLSHPAFRELLQKAEDEYGFPAAPGPVALPCDEDHFLDVLRRVSSSPASSCGLAMRRCSPRGESRPLLQAGRIVAVDEKLVW
jgi:SAUR family protein